MHCLATADVHPAKVFVRSNTANLSLFSRMEVKRFLFRRDTELSVVGAQCVFEGDDEARLTARCTTKAKT